MVWLPYNTCWETYRDDRVMLTQQLIWCISRQDKLYVAKLPDLLLITVCSQRWQPVFNLSGAHHLWIGQHLWYAKWWLAFWVKNTTSQAQYGINDAERKYIFFLLHVQDIYALHLQHQHAYGPLHSLIPVLHQSAPLSPAHHIAHQRRPTDCEVLRWILKLANIDFRSQSVGGPLRSRFRHFALLV